MDSLWTDLGRGLALQFKKGGDDWNIETRVRKFLKENDFTPVSIFANSNGSLIDLLFGKPPEVKAPRPF
ncbi:MAG: hypothetical protein KC493_16965 [Bacteriovoracaceae bacterium]|nr:hypothetical protein [Bacteriovoracaceae bacterium]